MRSAVFLDRDGVINENRMEHVKTWDEFAFVPGVLDALRRLATADRAIIVISNQSCIGRGLARRDAVDDIHARMMAEIERRGGRIDAIYFCPHAPSDGCDCRKPLPGLLFRAAEELGLDLARSVLIGDAVSDVRCARAAGCAAIMVLTGRGREQLSLCGFAADEPQPVVVEDLAAAVDVVLAQP